MSPGERKTRCARLLNKQLSLFANKRLRSDEEHQTRKPLLVNPTTMRSLLETSPAGPRIDSRKHGKDSHGVLGQHRPIPVATPAEYG